MMTYKEASLQEAYERRIEREREEHDADIYEEDDDVYDEPDYEDYYGDAADRAADDWYIQNARG